MLLIVEACDTRALGLASNTPNLGFVNFLPSQLASCNPLQQSVEPVEMICLYDGRKSEDADPTTVDLTVTHE